MHDLQITKDNRMMKRVIQQFLITLNNSEIRSNCMKASTIKWFTVHHTLYPDSLTAYANDFKNSKWIFCIWLQLFMKWKTTQRCLLQLTTYFKINLNEIFFHCSLVDRQNFESCCLVSHMIYTLSMYLKS